jgi:hypothetical protein
MLNLSIKKNRVFKVEIKMPAANPLANSKKGRAKNNLNNFDISQIEADLLAIESEALNLDQQSQRNIAMASTKSEVGVSEAIEIAEDHVKEDFKSREVNVVDFNPDNSLLLHRVLRSDSPAVSVQKTEPKKRDAVLKPKNKIQNLSFKVKPAPKATPANIPKRGLSLDGLGLKNRTDRPLTKQEKPLNTTAIALKGLRKANQFNQFSLRTHGTSLQRQIEKDSLFKKSFDSEVEVYSSRLETNDKQKVYNLKRRKAMLGGVDHHNLGPGKARKMLSSRSVKLLAPLVGVLIIGGYFMYLNTPALSIKMAETRSGISVSQPGYVPKGFKLSKEVEAYTGEVAMSFNNGQESYEVAQKVSDWDSKALLENRVLKETSEYSAYADRGLTIYVYDGKAVWVNQGKINEIELGDSKLDVEEMIRIAGSM